MGPKLLLHEAIAVVLLNKSDRAATFEEIAKEINLRNLYQRKDQTLIPAYQIMQRTSLSSGQYSHLFEVVKKDLVRLRNI